MSDLKKIVVVIDADNTELAKMGEVLQEISTHGRIVVKRAYGNWRKENLKNWEPEIKRLAIKAEQQFDYVPGKNATDMALVIDTIELLYTGTYDAFVIVSSDSDYTPLAIKLRESGVYVMGVGRQDTPRSFRNACDEFLLLENISSPKALPLKTEADSSKSILAVPSCQPVGQGETAGLDTVHSLLRKAYDAYQDDSGYANLAAVGAFVKRAKPDFDCRTYGYKKLPAFLAAFPDRYQVKQYKGKGNSMIVAFRCLEKAEF